MKRHFYKCTFLTDIIINESSATIGHSKTLDYIVGSNFLGIIANHYDKISKEFSKETSYKIFHSGNIHFGDAHLMINEKRAFKKPSAWFHEKMDTDQEKIYLHHKINDSMREDFSKKSIQLKQIRNGFFIIDDNKLISKNISHTYSLKSAHDIDKRKSKDEAMYGYDALNKGTNWIFYIDGNDEDIMLIDKYLAGEKSIGRSKTSQYGRVNISKLDNYHENIQIDKNLTDYNGKKILLIYFDSYAVFLDKFQQFSFQPDINNLLLDESASINWELSQIRTKVYSPWNNTRKTRDFDRLCIDKGSVLAVNIKNNFDIDKYYEKVKFGIGMFKNEGFGQILINPYFLTNTNNDATLKFNKHKPDTKDNSKKDKSDTNSKPIQKLVLNGDSDQQILSIIEDMNKENQNLFDVLEEIKEFIKTNKTKMNKIQPSQWGQVRSLAMRANTKNEILDLLFKEKAGFLVHGKAADQWRNHTKDLHNAIKKINLPDNFIIQFVINISSEMAKINRR